MAKMNAIQTRILWTHIEALSGKASEKWLEDAKVIEQRNKKISGSVKMDLMEVLYEKIGKLTENQVEDRVDLSRSSSYIFNLMGLVTREEYDRILQKHGYKVLDRYPDKERVAFPAFGNSRELSVPKEYVGKFKELSDKLNKLFLDGDTAKVLALIEKFKI